MIILIFKVFNVYMIKDYKYILKYDVLFFDVVMINIGNGYYVDNGDFIV